MKAAETVHPHSQAQRPSSWAHLPFVASIFLSAFLLFLVQPLVTQFLLPSFGGSPAVWNTALVFFQVVLLLGYLYAHGLVRLGRPVVGAALHLAVLASPLLLLPPAIPDFVGAGGAVDPSFRVLAILGVMVGLPFFALSTNASLVQHWWAGTGRPGSTDPYWLYGASNFGSLLALLAYPILVAPFLDLGSQARVWSAGYGVFVLVTLHPLAGAARAAWASRMDALEPSRVTIPDGAHGGRDAASGPGDSEAGSPHGSSPPPSGSRIAGWVARAALGSSLLLSLTMRITMDVGSVPLFWVLLLAVYLTTFILAFAIPDRLSRSTIEAGVLIGLLLSLGLLLFPAGLPYEGIVFVGTGTLFFGALLCHHDLARDRPDSTHLTSFYLWISAGGALGGVLNSLVAPLVFDSVAEYPLTLVALALLLHARPGGSGSRASQAGGEGEGAPAPRARCGLTAYRPPRWLGIAGAAGLALPLSVQLGGAFPLWGWALLVAITLLWGLGLSRYVGSVVATALIATLLASRFGLGTTVEEARSFFGVVRVTAEEGGRVLTMRHGTTVHGVQDLDPALVGTPLTYYHPSGPMGSAVSEVRPEGRIGVVGLGTGALAALADPGQEIVFHEIDPLVAAMAGRHFTFLADSPGEPRIVLGDGRITLGDLRDGYYELLILDAYSSDYVPIHLLTTEAVGLYLQKVAPGGVVLFHISNRFADLRRVIKGVSEALGRPAAFAWHVPSDSLAALGVTPSLVAAIARDSAALESLDAGLGWAPPDAELEGVVWTDAKASLLSVLR